MMKRVLVLAMGVGEARESLPLGAACVVAALREAAGPSLPADLEVELVEADQGEEPARIAERLAPRGAAALGLSVYTWNRASMVAVARLLRAGDPELLLFAGGPEATADPEGLLAEAPIDFTVVGEGEVTTVEALGLFFGKGGMPGFDRAAIGAGLATLPGIALPGGAAQGRRRLPIQPGTLPSPWLGKGAALAALAAGRDEVVWELSRGCAFKCAYCYEGRGEGGVRAVPRERIEAELALFVELGVRRVFVLDPTFNWKRERALSLLALFAEKAPGLAWKFEARAELLDRDLARAFSRLDCQLQIGLQSSDPEVLALSGRPGFEARRFAAKVALLDAEGLTWGLDLIYGLPGDSLAGFRRSLDYALGLQPNHLDVFPLAVLPGTELALRAAELGLVVEAGAPHLLLEAPGFPREDLAKAGALAAACDLFYTRGRAVSWFLRALAPLKARPGAFLGRFAGAMDEKKIITTMKSVNSREIEGLQLEFLGQEYGAKGLEALVPVLRDVVRFEGAWGRAIAEGETTELRLSCEASLVIEPPTPDLRELARLAKPRPSRIRVTPGKSGPRVTRLGPGQ